MSIVKENSEKIRVFALGGVGEIGKNMYIVEVGEDIFVIDSGLMFPDDDMLGVDIVIPDFSYLEENRDRVRAILLTHGHEDHIGSLPYVLQKISVPVYGTKLTLGLVQVKLKEAGVDAKVMLREINSHSVLHFGKTTITFFRTNHSIPDSVGIVIHTSQGAIVHTGDFKFDHTPVDGIHAEIGKMAAIGEKGVLCLLSDSTNAERPGTTLSETVVGEGIKEVFQNTKRRIIVTTFASNVHRIQQVLTAAMNTNRKIAVVGRSMVKVINIAKDFGYLKADDNLFIDVDEVNKYAPEQVAILTTGSQGEPMSALARIARGAHRHINITKNDTVMIAASPIPGNEKSVGKIIDYLTRLGVEVVYGKSRVHASGHGSAEELKLMLSLMKPKYFIPIHGEYRMQYAHSKLAESVGVHKENIFLIDNGDVVEFSNRKGRLAGKVPSGNVLIDGSGVGDVGNIVLRDRRLLSKDGIFIVVVTLNKQNGEILSGPDIISRGFVYVRESEELLVEANALVLQTLKKCSKENVSEWSSLKSNIRDVLSKFLFDKTKRRPMILPIIMEV